jgi:prevent-host-death family protein
MCYSPSMERIAIRELRNQASRVVRRARAGERMIITVDGVPAAEIGPVGVVERAGSDELIAAGALLAPRTRIAPTPATPLPAPGGLSSVDVLRQLRDR